MPWEMGDRKGLGDGSNAVELKLTREFFGTGNQITQSSQNMCRV